ncbi:unnamed protein product [Effrenium voratum]|nr:unnamed protein product [Effrenium voratum]
MVGLPVGWPSHRVVMLDGGGKGVQKGGPRPLTAAQRQIRDGDFQVQRAAGQKASEQVQEALELATWAQKQLAKASQQAELVLEKATQSQDYQQRSRAATPSEGGFQVQQQQVWMQQLSNELFNEAASIGDQILAQAESAIGTTKSAVIKVLAACDPLQALARKQEEATRVSKSQQLAQQAETQASRNLPAVERSRERLQSARDERDRSAGSREGWVRSSPQGDDFKPQPLKWRLSIAQGKY